MLNQQVTVVTIATSSSSEPTPALDFEGTVTIGVGGSVTAQSNELPEAVRGLDEVMGSQSALNSSMPAEIAIRPVGELEAPHMESKKSAPDIEAIALANDNLSVALKNYLRQEHVSEELFTDLAKILLGNDLSKTQIASKVLTYGDKDVNAQVKAWVMKRISESAETSALVKIAGTYFATHASEMEVLTAISSSGEDVTTLASALFATNHPELSSEIAVYLIGAETISESVSE